MVEVDFTFCCAFRPTELVRFADLAVDAELAQALLAVTFNAENSLQAIRQAYTEGNTTYEAVLDKAHQMQKARFGTWVLFCSLTVFLFVVCFR